MSMYEEDEVDPWDAAFSEAVREYLDKAGCSGVEWHEIPTELLREAEREALNVVGPKPKD
ncbi:hypothetical protein IRZ48_05510 [Pseudomonas fulva]|uniref:hypothetical protein n=1 Tax=Pseudomonas fulva TaxID=47880 RepID=UPI0018A90A50|nr:hypothetical protein [Pseudomonas fulva]MBF8636088.1 hypothetical protein [Pseudomonas fulva]MBF8688059.1 hypothetical protein [Pseudomonas fulva]